MKVLILYRPNSEHSRIVEEFVHDYKVSYPDSTLELVSLDTREGSSTAALYDVVQYPAILVLQANGSLQKIWEGSTLPQFDEVASYSYG